MRLLVSVFLACALNVSGGVSAQEPEDMSMADYRRPTMPVADLEASAKFFIDVLNMKEGGRAVYNSPVLRLAIGAPDGVDITVLSLNDRNQVGAIVLVNARGMTIDAMANATNATTLAFSVDDVNAVYERALAGGYTVLMSPEDAAKAENYPPEKEMILLEPGGHRLIVVQPPPTAPSD
jgi:catechol 2,3-dioxygenase-like lactoylglutathione lyase family enzyme